MKGDGHSPVKARAAGGATPSRSKPSEDGDGGHLPSSSTRRRGAPPPILLSPLPQPPHHLPPHPAHHPSQDPAHHLTSSHIVHALRCASLSSPSPALRPSSGNAALQHRRFSENGHPCHQTACLQHPLHPNQPYCSSSSFSSSPSPRNTLRTSSRHIEEEPPKHFGSFSGHSSQIPPTRIGDADARKQPELVSALPSISSLVGLYNEGNTCYLNSCLQCLAHTVPLASAILGCLPELLHGPQATGVAPARQNSMGNQKASMLTYAFCDLLKDLWRKPPLSVVSASRVLLLLQAWAPQFSGHLQQDAQEVMRAILDGLHEALNRVKTKAGLKYRDLHNEYDSKSESELANLTWEYHKSLNDSIVQDIFCGQLQSIVECSVCKKKSYCFDPFLDLSLPLPKQTSMLFEQNRSHRRWSVTLQDCISLFVAPETLSACNRYYCQNCKRFYGSGLYSYKKDDTPVCYPLKGLNLTGFISERSGNTRSHQAIYDLYAVCNHYGSMHSGHYTALCKNADGLWYSFNDSSVTLIDDAMVVNSSAYILFYQQRTD